MTYQQIFILLLTTKKYKDMEDSNELILLNKISNIIYTNRKPLSSKSVARVRETCDKISKSVLLILNHESNKEINTVKTYKEAKTKKVEQIIFYHYQETFESLRPKDKCDAKIWPRHLAGFLLREVVGLSLHKAGVLIGRDHATILNNVRRVTERMETEKGYNDFVTNIINTL